jgi:hypothetical protein
MTAVMTRDGTVHKASAGPSGPATECGRDEQVFVTEDRITCAECLKVVCPKCGQRVETEVLRGRVRWVTTTKVHLKPGPKVCHAIIKTEEHHDRLP